MLSEFQSLFFEANLCNHIIKKCRVSKNLKFKHTFTRIDIIPYYKVFVQSSVGN